MPAAAGTDDLAAQREALRRGHVPGLDGLRALAVLGVVIFHLPYGSSIDPAWLPGGWLGVSTFFTLSGFLITRVLLAEAERTGGISFGNFWSRRARRLLPALLVSLALTMVVLVARIAPADGNLPGQFLSTIFYVRNIYFLHLGGVLGSSMSQFWSLSVEEQFYLVCPVVFLVGVRTLGARRSWVLFAAAAIASLAMLVHTSRSGDWYQAYMGTPSRMFEILVGVLLAYLVTSEWFARTSGRAATRWVLGIAGPAGLAVTFWLWHRTRIKFDTLHGVLPVAALASAAVILACQVPGPTSRLLSIRPLRWVGRVSYGAYVYQLVVYFVMTPERTHLHEDWMLAVARLAVLLGLAGVSLRFMETPIRMSARLRGRRLLVAFGIPIAALSVAAFVVPFPKLDPTAIKVDDPFAANNQTATPESVKLTIVGDELTYASMPALKSVLADHPGQFRVHALTATDCPIGGAAPLARHGHALAPTGCKLLWFTFGAQLHDQRPQQVVLLGGIGNLFDRRDPDGTWSHLGEPSADAAVTRQLDGLLRSFDANGVTRVTWVLPTPDALAAAAAHDEVPLQLNGGTQAGVPADPDESALRARATRFEELVRAAAAKWPSVRVVPLEQGTTLDDKAWQKLLGG